MTSFKNREEEMKTHIMMLLWSKFKLTINFLSDLLCIINIDKQYSCNTLLYLIQSNKEFLSNVDNVTKFIQTVKINHTTVLALVIVLLSKINIDTSFSKLKLGADQDKKTAIDILINNINNTYQNLLKRYITKKQKTDKQESKPEENKYVNVGKLEAEPEEDINMNNGTEDNKTSSTFNHQEENNLSNIEISYEPIEEYYLFIMNTLNELNNYRGLCENLDYIIQKINLIFR